MEGRVVYKTPSGKYFVSVRKCSRTVFGGTFKHRAEAVKKARSLTKNTVVKKRVCMY